MTNKEKILLEIHRHKPGWAFSAIDFSKDFKRGELDVALSTLAEEGKIRRVFRGIYDYPMYSNILKKNVAPDTNQIAKAIARKFNWVIFPDGDTALNYLGLSTQMVAKPIYLSDGPSKIYTTEGLTIEFKHIAKKEIIANDETTALIIQAIRAVGEAQITDAFIETLAHKFTKKEWNSKQAAFNTVIEGRAGLFISGELKEMIRKVISPVCQIEEDETDKHVLHIIFPRLFDYGYIQPTIKLEIGPLALWNPHEQYQIDSFVGKYLPELELSKPIITTIKPERTFWEKITILHHEAHRPIDSAVPVRYSRHYYDIYKMGHTYVKTEALQNLDILKEVILFKKKFYPRGWAKYDEAVPGTMKLIPSSASIKVLEDDYSKMKRMIYGEVPDWNDIVKYLSELENEINNL